MSLLNIQIIHHKPDFGSVWIVNLQQIPNLICPVDSSSSLTGRNMPPACQRLCEYKNATGSITNVFSILTFRVSWLHRDGHSGFFKRLLIQVQNIFHASHKCCILFWRNTPALTKMWLELVFLKGALPPRERCCQCTVVQLICQPKVAGTILIAPLEEHYS